MTADADMVRMLHETDDALTWATVFQGIINSGVKVDTDLMVEWFANAMKTASAIERRRLAARLQQVGWRVNSGPEDGTILKLLPESAVITWLGNTPHGGYSPIYVKVKQTGQIPVISYIPAWGWRCIECGWLGAGHTSERTAISEAANHTWTDHEIAICASIDGMKQYGHPGHRWVHVKGTDSVERCDRCHEMIGK